MISKRLMPLAKCLYDLREWAEIESKCDAAGFSAWRAVRNWANGAAQRNKIDLDSVPMALKKQTANVGTDSQTRTTT